MGFLSHILLGDLGQSLDIEKTRSAVKDQAMQQARNTSKLFNAGIEIDRLKRQNGELRLAVVALTRFLIERGVVNEGELEAFIREIDAQDGTIDGSLASPPPKPAAP
jgi:hypothetical protein